MKYIIYDPFTENHTFLVNNLIENINIFNYQVEKVKTIKESGKNDIYIILINHMFLIENKKAQEDYQNLLKINNKKFLYITEPIELMIEKKFYQKMINELKPTKIFTYCEENLSKIKPICKYINFYPINKNYLRFIHYNKINKKDYNKIVFIGKMNDYRQKIKDIFKDDLVIIEDKFKKEDWEYIVNKYEYFVNIHRRPNSLCFESLRIIPLIYNECTVISEHVNKKEEEYFQGNNIYFCKLEEMESTWKELKKNEKKNNFGSIEKERIFRFDEKYLSMKLFFE